MALGSTLAESGLNANNAKTLHCVMQLQTEPMSQEASFYS